MYTLSEDNKYLRTDQKKSSINDYGEIKNWTFGDIIIANINGVEKKYCFDRERYNKYEFISYDFFVDNIQSNRNRMSKVRNSPEALFLSNYVNEIKIKNKCCVCGYDNNPRALVFDHIDPSQKKYAISTLVGMYIRVKNRRSEIFQLTIEEIPKCVVMCQNCHTVKTFENKCGQDKLKTHYDSPEDYLIKNGKSAEIYLRLPETDFVKKQKKPLKIKQNLLVIDKVMA